MQLEEGIERTVLDHKFSQSLEQQKEGGVRKVENGQTDSHGITVRSAESCIKKKRGGGRTRCQRRPG